MKQEHGAFVKGKQVYCRTCLRHDGRTISFFFFFFRTMAGWGDPWGRELSIHHGWGLRRIKPRRASGCLWNLENHPACSFVRVLGNFTSVSDHLIFPAVSVHRQDSYIIQPGFAAKILELYFLFVDPGGLCSGTSHKLLWGKGQERRVESRGTEFWLLLWLLKIRGKRASLWKWEQILYLSILLSMFSYLFRLVERGRDVYSSCNISRLLSSDWT